MELSIWPTFLSIAPTTTRRVAFVQKRTQKGVGVILSIVFLKYNFLCDLENVQIYIHCIFNHHYDTNCASLAYVYYFYCLLFHDFIDVGIINIIDHQHDLGISFIYLSASKLFVLIMQQRKSINCSVKTTTTSPSLKAMSIPSLRFDSYKMF